MERLNLKRLFSRQNSSADRRRKVRVPPPKGSTVLVVDDSKTVVRMVSRLLEQNGYMTLEAYDGESGIAIAKSQRVDLIIMDVMMPGINGFEATRLLRKDPVTANVPLILMSGNEEATGQFWASKIGANDFLVKPFDRASFFQVVEGQIFATQVA